MSKAIFQFVKGHFSAHLPACGRIPRARDSLPGGGFLRGLPRKIPCALDSLKSVFIIFAKIR